MFMNETLVSIASKYRRSVAQIVLRFLIQSGIVVIPKSVRKERMAENISIFDFVLLEEYMDRIRALDKKESLFFSHTDPETVERFMSLKR